MTSAIHAGPDVPPYVYLLGLAFALTLVIFLRAVSNKWTGKRPPIFEEIPFVGGIIGFVQSPIALARRGFEALGEVWHSVGLTGASAFSPVT